MSKLLRAVADDDIVVPGSFIVAAPPAGFHPWHSRVGDHGAPAPDDTHDPYAMGERDGYARAQAEWGGERAALVRLANSLTALQNEPAAPTALVIAEIVHSLVAQICGEVGVAQPLLLARARAAAELLDETLRPARLCLHPDDAALLAEADLPVAIAADTQVTRGSIRLETATGSIEDTLETRLAALRAQLNALALGGVNAGAEA